MFVSKDEYSKIFAGERLDEHNMKIRFDHMEKRRQDKFRIVVDERQRLLEMEKAGIDIFASEGNFKGTTKGTAAGLLSKEAALIEKMKKNQRKEIEQMMQYELEMQAIRQKNEEKARTAAEKESKRQQEVEGKRKEAELKRLKQEEERKIKQEELEAARRKLEGDMEQRELTREEEAKRVERERKEEAKKTEEIARRKREEARSAAEKGQEAKRLEAESRKRSMEAKDDERKKKLEAERSIKAQQLQALQEHHRIKIQETKAKNEAMIMDRKKKYDEKEKVADEKKEAFEEKKRAAHKANEEKFQKKEALLEKARSASQANLMKKKEDYDSKLRKNEEKKLIQEQEERKEAEARKHHEEENQRKREDKMKANKGQLEARKTALIGQAEEKDGKMRSAAEKRDAERMLRNNYEQMRKMDKLDMVKRNERKKEWERNRLWGKILSENEKIDQMKSERKNLLSEKANIKAKIDRDKEELAKKFQLVKEGRMDPHSLVSDIGGNEATGMSNGTKQRSLKERPAAKTQAARSVVNTRTTRQGSPPRDRSPPRVYERTGGSKREGKLNTSGGSSEKKKATGGSKIGGTGAAGAKPAQTGPVTTRGGFEVKAGETVEEATIRMKDVQGREMLRVLEEESKAEHGRDTELLVVTDMVERKRISKIHGVQKARAKERINQMLLKHDEELQELRQKLRS